MLSVQGKSGSVPWPEKDARAFFRGRDSRQERLDLVQLVSKWWDQFDGKKYKCNFVPTKFFQLKMLLGYF